MFFCCFLGFMFGETVRYEAHNSARLFMVKMSFFVNELLLARSALYWSRVV